MKKGHQYCQFGKEVKISLITLGISSRELALELGYKESTLCDVLKGRNRSERRKEEIKEALDRIKLECG